MTSVQTAKTMIAATQRSAPHLTVMLWGSPGIGKTSLVGQVAKEMGIGFKSVIAHLYQPVDVLGLPYIIKNRCEYAPPSVFPDVERDGAEGIFFLDELPNCVPAMQSAWGIVVLERSTKHYRFPPGWTIVCAGNRETDRAGSSRLVSALENRLIHVNVEPSMEEFLAHSVSTLMHPSVSAFLEQRPDMLSKFDPKSPERAFPSPRSWHRVSDVMKLNLDEGARHEMVKGAVGGGTAVEFASFSAVFRELPKLQDILDLKVKLSTITKPDVLRAAVYSVLSWTAETPDQKRFDTASQVAAKAADEWGVLLFRRLYELSSTKLMESSGWKELSSRFLKYIK